jgi:hypothetical protein
MYQELDLHNIKHSDVRKEIDSFLGHHIVKKTTEVKVVTGNSEVMKKIVKETLSEYNLSAEQSILNPGSLIVRL